MRKVDSEYWDDYFATYNSKKYDDLVNRFYAADATFQNPKYSLKGREQIGEYFTQHHADVDEHLTQVTVIITEKVAALELDAEFSSDKDLPDYYVTPLVKGQKAKMGMGVFYHLDGDMIKHVRIYWMKPS